MQRLVLIFAVLVGLAACAAEDTGAGAVNTAAPPASGAAVENEDDGAARVAAPASPRIESVYTSIDLDDCKLLESVPEEGGYAKFRCAGYGDIPLFISEGDLRMNVDIGVEDDVWISQGAFNTLGRTVEWRLHGGEPIAAILRYSMDSGMDERFSELGIFTIGTATQRSCLVAWVPGDAAPTQNEAARLIADRDAPGFVCP